MKKLFIVLAMLFCVANVSADYLGIVSRTTEDSLAIPFVLLDSIGNPASLASGDSVYIQITAPSGGVVYRDSMAYNDASIDNNTWEDFAGGQIYTYTEVVATLDGSSTTEGIYTVKIWANDLTSADLVTPTTHTFQLVNTALTTVLDSLITALADASIGDKVWTDASTRSITGASTNAFSATNYSGVTSLWNEGKTGYSLTQSFPTNFADMAITLTTGQVTVGTNNDKSGYALTTQDWNVGKTGYSISGTKTTLDALNDFNPSTDSVIVDVSSAQAGLIPIIADTNWLSLLTARDGVLGSFGDSAQGWGATSASSVTDESVAQAVTDSLRNTTSLIPTNVEEINAVASNADSLANMVDGGNDFILSLQQLDVQNSAGSAVTFKSTGGNGSGLILEANGSGDGLRAQADQISGTGRGFYSVGGGTSGQGIYALGGTIGDGFLAQGQGGQHGFSAIGQGTGSDISLSGTGFIASADDTVFMRGDIPRASIEIRDSIWDNTFDATLKSLTISNSAGSAVTLASTGGNGDGLQATGNGSGNGVTLSADVSGDGAEFIGGSASGRGAYIHSIATVSNSNGMQVEGAIDGSGLSVIGGSTGNSHGLLATGYGTGDAFHFNATGTGLDINAPDLVDLTWNEDSTGHYTAPHMAYLASQTGSGSGSGGADTTSIKTMIEGNFLPYTGTNYRYVSPDGDNTDGLTWATAWTTPDSISSITTGTNYKVFIDGADYDPVWACSVKVDYLSMIGVNGTPTFHYNTDTTGTGKWDGTNNVDVGECIYIDSLVDYGLIENIRFTGEGLYAYPHYGRDPDASHTNSDSTLSIADVGGKNAIAFQMRANNWTVRDCVFDSLYKPIIAIYVDDMIDSSIYGHTYENNTFRDVEYHAFDGAWSYSIFRNNTMIKTDVSAHPTAGAVQLISNIGAYNMVYGNYIHGFGYALYANVSDSNFFANNYLGSEIIADGSGEAERSYSTSVDAPNNFFVGNHAVGDNYMPKDGASNLLRNSGFEMPKESFRHIPFWGSNDWDATRSGYGADIHIAPFGFVNNAVDESDGSSSGKLGHSLFMMAGNTDRYIHQNSNVFNLDAGEAQFSMKVLPNSPIVAGDTVRVMLYEDTNKDYTFSALTSEVYYFTSDGGSNWENVSNEFTIPNAGNYYMSIHTWDVDSGDGFYYDDVFLGQYAGNVITTGNMESIAREVWDVPGADDSTYGVSTMGADAVDWDATGAGGSGDFAVTIHTVDTSGTDVAVEAAKVTIFNATTEVQVGSPQLTDASGETTWQLSAGDYRKFATAPLFDFPVIDTFTVAGVMSDTVYGYDVSFPTASTAHTCAVSVLVMGGDGNPRPNVKVTATLVASNLTDSSGYAISNYTQGDNTDANGIATINCVASTWVVPNTKWVFTIHDPSVGVRFTLTVPDQSSLTVNINDYR